MSNGALVGAGSVLLGFLAMGCIVIVANIVGWPATLLMLAAIAVGAVVGHLREARR